MAIFALVRNRFLKDASSVALGTALSQAIQILALFAVTRLYTAEAFGFFAIFSGVAWLCTVVATLQLEHLLLQPKSERGVRLIAGFAWLIIATATVFSVIAGGIIAVFVMSSGGDRTAAGAVWFLLGPVVGSLSVAQIIRYWCIRHGQFSALGQGLICGSVIQATTVVVVPWFFQESGPLVLAIGQCLGTIAAALFMLRMAKSSVPSLWPQDFTACVRFGRLWLKKAAKLTIAHGLKTAGGRLPIFIIGAVAASNGNALLAGHYALIERAVSGPQALVSNAVSDVFRQRASALWNSGHGFDRLVTKVVMIMFLLALPAFAMAIALAPWAFGLAFGPSWVAAGEMAQVLLVGEAAAFIFLSINGTSIVVRAESYVFMWHAAMCLARVITLAVVLIFSPPLVSVLVTLAATLVFFHTFDGLMSWRMSRRIPA